MRKVKYEFITEETIEIEISDEWGDKLKAVKREEWRLNKVEERGSVTFADLDGKELYFESKEYDPLAMIEEAQYQYYRKDHHRRIREAFASLSESQLELLEAIYVRKIPVKEYAEMVGVDHSAISKRLRRIKNKLEKVLR